MSRNILPEFCGEAPDGEIALPLMEKEQHHGDTYPDKMGEQIA